ncbi:MAG: galactitol-1-phosphate 5-dehydrogenase [Planctomycetota bacterium]|jgi:L-iditol 2-dehydrogenase|nr:galactitol-1-phosphate 5-dehydrogenase [Planctomycetota bacterium]
MKALVLEEYNSFAARDVPDPVLGDADVLVRVRACAICGSDVHGMDGSSGRRIPPIIMGHEASGTIEAVGGAVSGFRPGDRVTFDSTIFCGKCFFCRRGEINLCDNRKVLGVSCGDYRLHGAFAEFVAIPHHILFPVPDRVTFEQAAMVEPLSVAFHALRRSNLSLNDTAVVIGAGMIGLLVVQMLRVAGAGRIIAVDMVDAKLDMARSFGADRTLRSDRDDVIKEVLAMTDGRGADAAFEVVGTTPTTQLALASIRKGGSLTLVGNIKPLVEVSLQSAVLRQITLYGSCASAGEYPACLDLIGSGKVDVNSFISAVAPLSEGASWFKRLHAADPGLLKVILKP